MHVLELAGQDGCRFPPSLPVSLFKNRDRRLCPSWISSFFPHLEFKGGIKVRARPLINSFAFFFLLMFFSSTPEKTLSSSCVAKLNELYIFFHPRRSEYTLCCLCIYFVLTSNNEIYAVGIQKALSSSRATTLISTVDARGFSVSSLCLASSL